MATKKELVEGYNALLEYARMKEEEVAEWRDRYLGLLQEQNADIPEVVEHLSDVRKRLLEPAERKSDEGLGSDIS